MTDNLCEWSAFPRKETPSREGGWSAGALAVCACLSRTKRTTMGLLRVNQSLTLCIHAARSAFVLSSTRIINYLHVDGAKEIFVQAIVCACEGSCWGRNSIASISQRSWDGPKSLDAVDHFLDPKRPLLDADQGWFSPGDGNICARWIPYVARGDLRIADRVLKSEATSASTFGNRRVPICLKIALCSSQDTG